MYSTCILGNHYAFVFLCHLMHKLPFSLSKNSNRESFISACAVIDLGGETKRIEEKRKMDRAIFSATLPVKAEKRNKLQIYYDVLLALHDELRVDVSCLTRVAHRANVPYDRFRKCLDELTRLGLLSGGEGTKIFVTENGFEYIRELERMNDFLRRIGLLP